MWVVIEYNRNDDSTRALDLLAGDSLIDGYFARIKEKHYDARRIDGVSFRHVHRKMYPYASGAEIDYYLQWLEPINNL